MGVTLEDGGCALRQQQQQRRPDIRDPDAQGRSRLLQSLKPSTVPAGCSAPLRAEAPPYIPQQSAETSEAHFGVETAVAWWIHKTKILLG